MGKPRERALIQDYIAQRYPNHHVIMGCPLGPVPESIIATWGRTKALRIARGMRPEVDALVFQDSKLIMIEAKIFKWVDGLAKLPMYKGLIPTTPELEQYKDLEVEMVLCTPWTSETIEAAAAAMGVRVDVYSTPDIDVFVEETHKYWTKEYQSARDEKKRARSLLGLE